MIHRPPLTSSGHSASGVEQGAQVVHVPLEPELHRLGWFVFQSGVFRWDSGGGVVVSGH